MREFLTNSSQHPQGIKVRLADGSIGRVAHIVDVGSDGGAGGSESGEASKKNSSRGVGHATDDENGNRTQQAKKPKTPLRTKSVAGSTGDDTCNPN